MKGGLAALRIAVGGLFVGHGLQKLAGRFGGQGLDATGEAFESLDLRPGKAHAAAAGASETLGGALLTVGLFTPLASSLITGTMITAIRKVHAPKGPWASNGGYEYNLVLIAVAFALTDLGPGEWSLDEALGIRRAGLGWALAELATGLAGSAIAIELASRVPARAPAREEAPADEDGPSPNGAGEPLQTQASAGAAALSSDWLTQATQQ